MEPIAKGMKLKDTKKGASLDGAQYILTFRPASNQAEAAVTSFRILSALKGEGDMILELNSRLLYTERADELIFRYIDTVKKLGLDYRYRKLPGPEKTRLLEQLIGKPRKAGHELYVSIKAADWYVPGIMDIVAPLGVRYYFSCVPSMNSGLLDSVINMTDAEKLANFGMIAFDMGILGHIGLNAEKISADEIAKKLGIK